MANVCEVSVVLPVYNEAENLPQLLSEIAAAIPDGTPYEVLCVDDRSKDDSLAVARGIQAGMPQLRIIRHSLNSGQSAAVYTGFRMARGNVVITMDADCQNDPADIPKYLAALTPEVDCVTGIRGKRQDTWAKRRASKIANGFRNWITGDRVTDAGCGFRAIRRDALRELPAFNGLHRFVPTLLRMQGFTVVEIPINHRARTRGESKYGINDRLWRGIRDCFAMRWFRARSFTARRIHPEDLAAELPALPPGVAPQAPAAKAELSAESPASPPVTPGPAGS